MITSYYRNQILLCDRQQPWMAPNTSLFSFYQRHLEYGKTESALGGMQLSIPLHTGCSALHTSDVTIHLSTGVDFGAAIEKCASEASGVYQWFLWCIEQGRQSCGVWWVATPRFWAGGLWGGRGQVVKYYYNLSCDHEQEVCSKVVTFEEKQNCGTWWRLG